MWGEGSRRIGMVGFLFLLSIFGAENESRRARNGGERGEKQDARKGKRFPRASGEVL